MKDADFVDMMNLCFEEAEDEPNPVHVSALMVVGEGFEGDRERNGLPVWGDHPYAAKKIHPNFSSLRGGRERSDKQGYLVIFFGNG